MALEKKAGKSGKRALQEIVSIDYGTTALKVVKLKMIKEQLTLVGAELLPAIDLTSNDERLPKMELGSQLLSNYSSICFNSDQAIVRLINLPAQSDPSGTNKQIREQFNIDADAFRLSHMVLNPHHAKSGLTVMAVAVPEYQVQLILSQMASGPPAPRSMEVAGLTSLTSFMMGYEDELADSAVCFIETGAKSTFIFFINRGNLVLLRKYDLGGEMLFEQVEKTMGVDREMALSIITEGAIDLSGMIQEVMGFLIRQLTISRDFVERQENCRIGKVFLSGGVSMSTAWLEFVANATNTETEAVNPFKELEIAPDAIPEKIEGHEPRFTAAIGAGLGAMNI